MSKDDLRRAIALAMETPPAEKTYAQIEQEDQEDKGGNYTCWTVRSPNGWWVVNMDYGWATANDMLNEPAEWEPVRKSFDKCAKVLEDKIVQAGKIAEYVEELFSAQKIPYTDRMFPGHVFRAVTARPSARCQAALTALGYLETKA